MGRARRGAPTHSHPVEEMLTVREGEAEMWIDGERVVVSAGQSLIVPAGRKHGFRNSGATILHIHAVLASPVFEASRKAQRKRRGGGIGANAASPTEPAVPATLALRSDTTED